MERVLVIKNVSLKLFSFLNGECIGGSNYWRVIGDQETCLLVIKNVSLQILQLLPWRVDWWSRSLRFLQWKEYLWSRTCLSNSSASLMEGVLVIKNVSVKFYSFFNGGYTRDQDRVCQALQLLQWRVYSLSRTCLSNSSISLMEGLLMIKNVSVKLFNFSNGGSIGDQERVCQTLQFLQWRVYWWSRTCLSNSSATSMEGVLVIKNVSVKVVSFFNGRYIRYQERVCQPLQLPKWRVYWLSRTCLSNSSASLMEGIFVTKNVSVKRFSFFNGGYIHDQERVCQTLQLL